MCWPNIYMFDVDFVEITLMVWTLELRVCKMLCRPARSQSSAEWVGTPNRWRPVGLFLLTKVIKIVAVVFCKQLKTDLGFI